MIKRKIITQPPKNSDVEIVDGFFNLHLMKEIPRTFGVIPKKILQMITNTPALREDIIFDRYKTPSIKHDEYMQRGIITHLPYTITSREQVKPPDFSKWLWNAKFKEVINCCSSDEIVPFLSTKSEHLNFDNCYPFKVVNGSIDKNEIPSLSCEEHEEADSKILFNVLNTTDAAEIVIR